MYWGVTSAKYFEEATGAPAAAKVAEAPAQYLAARRPAKTRKT